LVGQIADFSVCVDSDFAAGEAKLI